MSVVYEADWLFCKRVVQTWQSKMASKMDAVFCRSRQKHLESFVLLLRPQKFTDCHPTISYISCLTSLEEIQSPDCFLPSYKIKQVALDSYYFPLHIYLDLYNLVAVI